MRQEVCVRSTVTNRESTEEWAQREEGEPKKSLFDEEQVKRK